MFLLIDIDFNQELIDFPDDERRTARNMFLLVI